MMLTRRLAAFAGHLRFEDLPPEVGASVPPGDTLTDVGALMKVLRRDMA